MRGVVGPSPERARVCPMGPEVRARGMSAIVAQVADIGEQVSQAIVGVLVEIIDVLTPIVNVLGIAMVILGLLIGVGLRQEWIGYRLIISGGIALAFMNLVLPLLLEMFL